MYITTSVIRATQPIVSLDLLVEVQPILLSFQCTAVMQHTASVGQLHSLLHPVGSEIFSQW